MEFVLGNVFGVIVFLLYGVFNIFYSLIYFLVIGIIVVYVDIKMGEISFDF